MLELTCLKFRYSFMCVINFPFDFTLQVMMMKDLIFAHYLLKTFKYIPGCYLCECFPFLSLFPLQSLNSKHRTIKKNGGDISDVDQQELERVSASNADVQKILDKLRKQQRQHASIVTEHRNKKERTMQQQRGAVGVNQQQPQPPHIQQHPGPQGMVHVQRAAVPGGPQMRPAGPGLLPEQQFPPRIAQFPQDQVRGPMPPQHVMQQQQRMPVGMQQQQHHMQMQHSQQQRMTMMRMQQQQRMMGPNGGGIPMRGPGPGPVAAAPHMMSGGGGPPGGVSNYRAMGSGRVPPNMVGVGGGGMDPSASASPPQMGPRMNMVPTGASATTAVVASPQQQFSAASSPSITPPQHQSAPAGVGGMQQQQMRMTSPMHMPSSSPLPSPSPALSGGGSGTGQPHMSPMHHPSPSPQPSMSPSPMQLNHQQHYPNSQSPHSGPSPRNPQPGGHVRYRS